MTPPPPVPPHEREWRHPSELPAPPHEPPTPGGRLLIVATAAIGLALVGVMALRMTPGRTPQRDALVTVSTSAVFPTVSANSFGELAEAASNGGRRFTDLLGRTLSSFFASPERAQISASTIARTSGATPVVGDPAIAVVTPVGTEGLGVTTAAAVEGRTGIIEAMLPSGAIVAAELLGTDSGIAVVALSEIAVGGAARLAGATKPSDDLTVVAFGDEFSVSDDGGGLQALAVPEAAPIFDDSGALVGLCTFGPDGVEMLRVASLPDITSPPVPETTEAIESTDTATVAVATDAAGSVPAVNTDPANPPATTSEKPPASSGVPSTEESVVSTSDPTDSSEPATTGVD